MKLPPLSCLSCIILYSLTQLTTTAAATTTTIDDSAWNTHALQLSSGWNMLRPSQTEAIDPFEVSLMRPLLPLFFNQSISWTRQKNANYTLRFTGTSITIYSPHGPSASRYSITLDSEPIPEIFDARAETFQANKTVWHREGLSVGEHTVVVRHEGEGYLYFDWAEVFSHPATTSEAPKPTAPAQNPVAAPFNLPYDPSALQRLTEVYHFKMNSRVYFVIIIGATMLLLSLALIALHRHRHPTHPTASRKSKSFINGPVPSVPKPQPPSGALAALKRHLRKSKISNPVPHAPGEGYRAFEDEDLVLAPQARKLRPRDIEDAEAGEERGLSLADALRESVGGEGRGKRVTRDMF